MDSNSSKPADNKTLKHHYKIAIKYAVFAGIAICTNLITQKLSLLAYGGVFSIYIAIIFGTGTGLLVKYVLDKRFIFYFTTQTHAENLWKFILYSTMGIVTTAIFWGTELSFHFVFGHPAAKYAGGAIGLSIGYYVKYLLDKRFVFIYSNSKCDI